MEERIKYNLRISGAEAGAVLSSTLGRFILTGVWNTASSYVITALLYYLLSKFMHYIFIISTATVINITNAYVCHKLFVFRTRGNIMREYLRYYVVYAIPIGFSFVAFPFCMEILRMNFYLTQAILTAITVFISYFGHKHISFKKRNINIENR